MKPTKQELWLPTENHDALLADLGRIAGTGLLPVRKGVSPVPSTPSSKNADQLNPVINSEAVSLFLEEVVKRHLPPEMLQTLQQVNQDQPPILVIGNLPNSEAAERKKIAGAESISGYLLRGIATLLDQDPGVSPAQRNRSDIYMSKVAESLNNIDPGLGYHRDGLSAKQARQSGRPYPPVANKHSLLLYERENIYAAVFFIDPATPGIQYFQNLSVKDREPPVNALAVVPMAGELYIFPNNELLHGRIATASIDPEHLRSLTSAILLPSGRKYTMPPPLNNDTLEARCAEAVAAGMKELAPALAR